MCVDPEACDGHGCWGILFALQVFFLSAKCCRRDEGEKQIWSRKGVPVFEQARSLTPGRGLTPTHVLTSRKEASVEEAANSHKRLLNLASSWPSGP